VRTFRAIALALACGASGCGDRKSADNSGVQSPDDRPLGGPRAVGGGASAEGQMLKQGGGAGKPLPAVEVKPRAR